MTIVFIPGTLCDENLFLSQLESLKRYTCVVADHSYSDSLSKLSEHVFQEVTGPMIVIGLSYGGIIAMEMMRQNSERIVGLVLLNTNHRHPSATTKATQERFVGMAELGRFEDITKDFLKDAMLHPENAKNEELRKTVMLMTQNTGKQKFVNQIKAQLGRPDSRDELHTYKCPVLLITGSHDSICTPSLHQEMADLIPQSELHIIEGCGHLSTMEKPEEVNYILNKWLHKNIETNEEK